jgi:hypothetical protein
MGQCGGHCGEAYALVCMCSACGTASYSIGRTAVLHCHANPTSLHALPTEWGPGPGAILLLSFPQLLMCVSTTASKGFTTPSCEIF